MRHGESGRDPRAVRVLVAPDKFKGSLTSDEVAAALTAGVASAGVAAVPLPLADGGDGSVAVARFAGYAARPVVVTGAAGHPVEAMTAWSPDGTRAIVEVANTCGIAQLHGGVAPLTASTLGFGEAVRTVVTQGAREVVLALGGSASTDGGTGLLTALGVRLLDADGGTLTPMGATLTSIAAVDTTGLVDLSGIRLVVAGDVDNPLLGARGAAAAYGPQKGATAEEVTALEHGLAHLVQVLERQWPQASRVAGQPGAGAAGGLGFALALLGGRLVAGADLFLDLLGFDAAIEGCTHVVTGEGRADATTLAGKVPARVIARAGGRAVHLVVGSNALTPRQERILGAVEVLALDALTTRDPSADPALSGRLLTRVGHDLGTRLRRVPRAT